MRRRRGWRWGCPSASTWAASGRRSSRSPATRAHRRTGAGDSTHSRALLRLVRAPYFASLARPPSPRSRALLRLARAVAFAGAGGLLGRGAAIGLAAPCRYGLRLSAERPPRASLAAFTVE